jgi:serine/threonine protein phosphatase PrpC
VAAAVQDDADALDELLAGVAATDADADADADLRVSAATATTDTTLKAASFWTEFEDKVVVVAAAADTAQPSGAGGDSNDLGLATLDIARAMSESSRPLPDKLAPFSTSGIVQRGHVDIDSEDEADELLAETVISGSSRFAIGFADTKGTRSTMEDEMVVYGTFRDSPLEDYVAVFDGHGGSEASAVAAEELHELLATHLDAPQYAADPGAALKAAFESCQRTIEQAVPPIQSGTTAVVAYFQGARCWIANAGDSRAIVCRRANGAKAGALASPLDLELTRVTTDHKPSLPAEEARIKAAGGFVSRTQTKRGEVSRVCAVLGVARALGDTFLQPMVTCVPDVHEVPFRDYDALILACDGLWDVVSDAEAAAVALNAADAGEAARRLRDFAFARNSDDNVSVLVVHFTPPPVQ